MPEEELQRESAKRKRQASPVSQFLSLTRRPDVLEILRALPPVPTAVSLVKKVLSQDQWLFLKTRLHNGSQSSNGNGAIVRPLYMPDELMLQMYKSKTNVRIDKAKSRLGYVPKFDFERGMSLTARVSSLGESRMKAPAPYNCEDMTTDAPAETDHQKSGD